MKRVIALAIVLGCIFFAQGTVEGKTLRWSSQGDYLSADPHAAREGLTNSINYAVYERLVGRGKKLEAVPQLALSWEQTNPTTWIFKLRKRVQFFDGATFTADDVVFSIERAQTPPSNFRSSAIPIGKPRKIDDYTVEFTTPAPNPVMVALVSSIPIMNKAWCVRNKVERSQDLGNKEESHSARNSNGTGPFMLTLREPDIKSVFKKNPNWWGIAERQFEGNVDEIVYLPMKSDATRIAALASGEIDFVLDPPVQNIEQLKRNPELTVYEGREDRIIFLGMDQARDELQYSNVKGKNPFKDKRVRQAMYQAIDIDTIKTQVMRGLSMPTGNTLPNPTRAGIPDSQQKRRPYDVEAAKKLLADAGYEKGFDVTLDCPNNRYVNDEKICVAVAVMLSKIGINVKVNAMPRAQWLPKGMRRDTSFYMFGWGDSTGEGDAFFTLLPLMRSPDNKGYGEFNWGSVRDEALDKLIDAQASEVDVNKRHRIIVDAVKMHDENFYHLPLHIQFIPWASRKNVEVIHLTNNYLIVPWIKIK